MLAPVFHAGEPSHGDIAASLDRLIVSPLHKSGPRKGKQTVVTLADGQEHPVTPPRGYAGHQVLACNAGHYWLAPMPQGLQPGALCAAGVHGGLRVQRRSSVSK